MEPNNIDSAFRKAVNESAGPYEFEADQSKGRIWQQIQSGKSNRALPVLFRLLLAACILLFFCSTVLSILLFREKKSVHMLAEANRIVKTESSLPSQKIQTEKVTVANAQAPASDTVYIKRNVIIYQPLITTEKQVDTVYIRQVVFKEREQSPEMIAANPNNIAKESVQPDPVQSYGKEIVISNKQAGVARKKGKLLLKLGGNNSPSGNGSLAFTVNL
jgi:hypothetical protein